MKSSIQTCLVLVSLAISSLLSTALAISSDQPAAIVTYPQIVVDTANGVDTFLHITNRDPGAVDARCFLENHNRHCDDSGNVCLDDSECPASFCRQDFAVDEFTVRLTARQPFGWQASVGATTLPHPDNQGSIPAVPEDPFRGSLRCVAADEDGAPVDRNVLKGTATLERFVNGAPVELDAARYNAVGFQAIPGANDGDNELILGGAQAEYEGCPNTVLINHFFDFAIEPMTHSSQVLTDLIVVPCGRDLFHEEEGPPIATFLVYNEFEQRFSSSRAVNVRLDGQMSLIDTDQPNRSVFSAGVAGTLTGQTLMSSPGGGGVLAVAVERHESIGVPGGTTASAAFNLHSQGERSGAEVFRIGRPPLCRSVPAAGCRTAKKSTLFLRDDHRGDQLRWRFGSGEATSAAELGSPSSTTDYGFCLYVALPATLRLAAEIPASATKWRAFKKGQRYEDPAGSEDGIERLTLRTSKRQRSRVLVNGGGSNLQVPNLPLQLPIKVQVTNSETGVCWEAEYWPDDVVKNAVNKFRAKK
jgi:hypothetical protein